MKQVASFIFASAIALGAFAQSDSFHEDSRHFDIKLDFAGYNGTIKDNFWEDVHPSSASSVILTPQMSWALGRGVSLGWSLGLSHYLDTGGTSTQLNGCDGSMIFDVHFLRRPRTDMMFGLKFGLAGIRLDANDGTGNVYGSLGPGWDVHWMNRFYVTDKLAIIANIGLPGYTFNKFGKNTLETWTIKWRGFCIGTGVTFKLLNQKTAGSARNK